MCYYVLPFQLWWLAHTVIAAYRTLREILPLQESVFVSQLVPPSFSAPWSSFGPHGQSPGRICQVYRGIPGEFYFRMQQLLGQWGLVLTPVLMSCHCILLPQGPVTARYVFIHHISHRTPKVFPVPRRCDMRPSLWTWWGKPEWVAIDRLKPAHLDPEEPVELALSPWGGQPCFSLWPSHRPHCCLWPCFGKDFRPIFILDSFGWKGDVLDWTPVSFISTQWTT